MSPRSFYLAFYTFTHVLYIAVQFMWDNVIESVEKPVNSGCILAHCMGLGKTLSVRLQLY